MNKNLHRIIFNAARGQRMVVAETATSHGGSNSVEGVPGLGGSVLAGSVTAALSLVAFGVLVLFAPAYGQIKADASAPGNQRPTILQTANGVPQINIQTPSAAGVSRNQYSQFDVQSNGAILNNSRTNTQTQIGGMVAANPWLATGPARVILNEVNSSNPSYLKGPVEVAGQRAEVIIANPSGISVSGGSFINAAGVTLTTGTPVMNSGNLESFRVQKGMVNIEGLGLDTSTADYTRILARAMQVNAGLWAKNLTVVTGSNDVKALASGADATATKTAGTGAAPSYMLDVAAIGGMYSGHIYLVGTEAGLGVNNRGTIAAQEGTWVLRADGWLVNTGKAQAKGDLTVNVTGAISNTGRDAVISSQGNAALTSDATIANTGGATLAATGTLDVKSTGALTNTGSTVAANGAVRITAAGIDNTAGTLASVQSPLNVNTGTQALNNTQGMISAGQGASIDSGALNNDQGLIQAGTTLAIDTHGQTLTNTNSGLAGIVAGRAATLTTGDFNNSAGYLGTGGNLTVTVNQAAGQITNTAGGQIVSEADLSLTAPVVNNQGGKVQALGNIGITARAINNAASTIEANGDVILTATGALDNSGGTLSAGQNLTVQDTAVSRTLTITNTGGTAESGANNTLKAASLTGDGTVQAAGDLAIDLQSDFESNTDLVASGNASVTTTGTFTNRARLNAGQTATASAANVVNTATGEIAGEAGTTVTAASSLTNRGLIDGGETRINAGTLTNIGTGRIYGDHVAIAAGTLTNDTETIGSVRSDAVIAARERLDLGVGTLANREHALIFSAGTGADALNIGGSLNASGHATGSATTINNNSATIESLGGLSINATRINNTNAHFSTEVIQKGSTTTATEYTLGAGDVVRGQDLSTHWLPNQVSIYDCESLCITVQSTGDTSDAFVEYRYTSTPYETVVKESDPAQIIAAGNMNLMAGAIFNDKSQILAGGALNVAATTVDNTTVQGERRWVNSGTATSYWRVRHSGRDGYGTGTSAYKPADTVEAITLTPTKLEGNANVAGSGTQVAVRVVTPDPSAPNAQVLTVANAGPLSLPASSLFRVNPDPTAGYLIVTDPRFTDLRQWLGSDYMLSLMASDPATVQKRLGDGFYEQKLIRDQVAQLTGRRFLDGYANDEVQYRALMDSGVTFAQQWNLVPGVALTAEQMARLTSDIVWLVAREVTLPDGTQTTALVPQVYVRAQDGDLAPSGALLAGQSVNLNLAGDLTNSGTIAGRQAVVINAQNIQNLGGQIKADAVSAIARTDLNNIGGSLIAKDSLDAQAGRDLNVQSTTRNTGSGNFTRTGIDRVAGLYVTGDGGTLMASAGRDANIVVGVLQSNGSIEVSAANNVNLATVTTSESSSIAWNSANWRKESSTQEVGSQIAGTGTVRIAAGNDLTARAATVNAGGALAFTAGNNVSIEAGQNTRDVEEAASHKSKGTFSSRTLTTHDKIEETQAVGSSFGGNTVSITAGNNLGVKGTSVVSDNGTSLAAANNIAIEAAENTYSRDSDRLDKKSGLFSGGGIGITAGTRKLETGQDSQSTTAVSSTVGSIGGDVAIVAGQTYRQTGSDVLAPAGDINIAARKIEITEARETSSTVTEQKFSQSGLTLQITSPVISAVQTAQAMAQAASDTGDDRMKLLAAANVGFAANNALNAMEAGKGVTTPDGKTNQVTRTGLDGTKTTTDSTAVDQAGGVNLSISIGGSKSSSTTTQASDSARGSTVAAGGSVNIEATGAGADSDVLVRGSDVTAGTNATLKADGDVSLLAAQDTASLSGSNKSSSGSIGISIGTSGFGITASASAGRGNQAGDDVTQTNTHVTAGNTVNIQSGVDTTLQGAVVKADTVKADVAGNLNITSLQDTSTYTSQQKSVGGSVTIGAGGGGSFNAAKSNVNSDYASVAEQSGIKAGNGGFQVSVGNNTDLKGGVIASNQAAVEQDKNSLSTGGSLTTSDIQNQASYSAKSTSVGVGTGGSASMLGISGVGIGVGSDSGQASSTTQAGISGIAGNTSVRSTDAETGIQKIFDQDRVQREVDAQAKITETFGREASKAIGDYASTQMKEANRLLSLAGDATLSQDQRDALTAQAQAIKDQWGDNGTLRLLAHTVVGGLTGGASGAAGAAAGTLSAPAIANALANAGIAGNLASTLTGIGSTLIGAAAGGTAGGAAALNEVANNYLKHAEARRLSELKDKRFAGQCNSACETEIKSLEALDQRRDKEFQACQGQATATCGAIVAEVRNAAAEYVRANASVLGTTTTYANERGEAETLARQTMDGYTVWNKTVGAAESVWDGFKALGGAAYTGFKALVGDPQAQNEIKQIGSAGLEFLSDPNNWPQLLGAMSPAQREELARAYETGNGAAIAKTVGEAIANLPMGGGAGTIKKVGQIAEEVQDINALANRMNVERVVLVPAGSKGNWDPSINTGTTGSLVPNTAYRLDNGHTYVTDASGRVNKVEGNLSLETKDRNTYQQACAGQSGCVGDDGGHLIASSLGGAGDRVNLVPQAATLNRNEWKAMEREFGGYLKEGKAVSVKIEVGYPTGSGVRPDTFKITATVDGKKIEKVFEQ